MNVTETSADGLKRAYKIVIPSDQITGQIESKLKELSRTIKLPGFRPGKVPVAVVRQRFGQEIRHEVLEETVRESVQATIRDRGLRTAVQPSIELDRADEGADLEYTLSIELMPDIEPIDFSQIALERWTVEIGEDEIDRVVTQIAEGNQPVEPVAEARPAVMGDMLMVDYTATHESKPLDSGTDARIDLGAGVTIAGFDEQLVGAVPGDQRQFELTLPEDYPNEAVAGKTLSYDVSVKQILEKKPVEIDEAFAEKLGFTTLQALRQSVRDQLSSNYNRVTRARLKRQLLDKLAETHDFPVPAGLVDGEFEAIWERLQTEMAEGRAAEEDKNKSEDELRAEYRGIAERRVRLGLLLAEVGKRNNIEVTRDELNRAVLAEARRYPGQERDVLDFYRKNPEAADGMKAPLFEDKVVDFIIELATVTTRSVSTEELMRTDTETNGETEA